MPRTAAQDKWAKENTTRVILICRNHIAANLRKYCKEQGTHVTTYLLSLARADMARNGANLDEQREDGAEKPLADQNNCCE